MPSILDEIHYENYKVPTLSNQAGTANVSRVSQGMTLLYKLITENGELVNQVEQRLHAVLRPPATQSAGEVNSSPRQAVSPMSEDLEAFAGQLQLLLSRYHDILERLEI